MINDIKKGDILVLSDYHALVELGGKFEVEIESVEAHILNDLTITLLSFDYNGDTMALAVKTIDDITEYYIYRTWTDGLFIDIARELGGEDYDLATTFEIELEENSLSSYKPCTPFPLYGFYESTRDVYSGIGEYMLENECDKTYWATNSLLVWNIDPDSESDDLEKYATLYFGWSVTEHELEFIRK